MKDKLIVKVRDQVGTGSSRRVRKEGLIPAVLYGHGEANLSLSVPKDQVLAVVRHGGRLVDLSGDVNDSALIRQVQWDAFGIEIIHIDLSRVSAGETVDIVLPIEMKGTAPGLREGGVVELVRHDVHIKCPVVSLPEKLVVNVSNLHLDQSIALKDLVLPEGASLLNDADDIVVHCVPVKKDEDAAAGAPESSEPEVIARKKEAEEEAE
jgi:large subunit ribosomal protein L25